MRADYCQFVYTYIDSGWERCQRHLATRYSSERNVMQVLAAPALQLQHLRTSRLLRRRCGNTRQLLELDRLGDVCDTRALVLLIIFSILPEQGIFSPSLFQGHL